MRRFCGILAALVACASATCGMAAEILPGPSVPPYTLCRVRLAEGERVWILPWGATATPPEVETAANGDLVWVAPPGQYAVLWFSQTSQGQAFVTIGGDVPIPPGPGPDPTPPLPPGPAPEGFAGDVYREAIKVGMPTECKQVATALRGAITAIGDKSMDRAKAIAHASSVVNALSLSAGWRSFGAWYGQQATQRAQTRPQVLEFLSQVVVGLEAAAR